jgi:hypothetical protein
MSHAFSGLTMIKNGVFKNESILEAVDLYHIRSNSDFVTDRILVCTDIRIIFVKDLKDVDINVKLKDIRSIEIESRGKGIQISTLKKRMFYVKTDLIDRATLFVNNVKALLTI